MKLTELLAEWKKRHPNATKEEIKKAKEGLAYKLQINKVRFS
jgi:hypothetical protein